MIYIITGGIDEGKTQKMAAVYSEKKQGDGFLSKKIFNEQKNFAGYEIVRLSSGEKLPLAYKTGYVPVGWDEIYRRGPFSFSRAAFVFAGKIIDDVIQQDIQPVFIDEIGPLELSGRGFSALLTRTLNLRKDVYIAVRSHCAEEVIKHFNIEKYEIIKIATDLHETNTDKTSAAKKGV